MKTKLIRNSVKQWADRAVLGVKSLIEWFRTGENKNREIKERTENRQRCNLKLNNTRSQERKIRGGTVQCTPL